MECNTAGEQEAEALIHKGNVSSVENTVQREELCRTAKAVFGGKLEYIICGVAPLNPKYAKEFRDFGIVLLNGYGITECSPVVAVNRNEFFKDDSVGRILDECRVRIKNPD